MSHKTCCGHDHGSCGHGHHEHHHEGPAGAEAAFIWSDSGTLRTIGSVGAGEAVRQTEQALLSCAQAAQVEGIVPGHIKALLTGGGQKIFLSVTEPGCCRRTQSGSGGDAVWQLAVDVILAVQPPEDIKACLEKLFEKRKEND